MLTPEQIKTAWRAALQKFGSDLKPEVAEFHARYIESAATAPLLERIAALKAERDRNLDSIRVGNTILKKFSARIAELEAERDQVRWLFNKSKDEFHTARQESSLRWQMICDLTNQRDALEAMLAAAPAAPEQQEPRHPQFVAGFKAGHVAGRARGAAAVAQAPNAQQEKAAFCAAIDAREAADLSLRSNAQQAEAPPVAEVIIGDDEFDLGLTDDYAFGKLKLPNGRHMLYTEQPKAVPLTEAQAREIWRNGIDHGDDFKDALGLIRATEAAHGIGV